jgi:hypothetical protein
LGFEEVREAQQLEIHQFFGLWIPKRGRCEKDIQRVMDGLKGVTQ